MLLLLKAHSPSPRAAAGQEAVQAPSSPEHLHTPAAACMAARSPTARLCAPGARSTAGEKKFIQRGGGESTKRRFYAAKQRLHSAPSIKECFIPSYSPTQCSMLTVSLAAGTEAQPRGTELLTGSH